MPATETLPQVVQAATNITPLAEQHIVPDNVL